MRSSTLLLTLAACGGGGHHDVTITTITAPQFIVARNDADATWTTLTAGTAGTSFAFRPTGPYRVTAGCDEGDGLFTLWQVARTPSDDPKVDIPCGTSPRTATLSGTMVQAGEIDMDDAIAISQSPNWQFQVQTAIATHPLIAISADHIQIQRELIVTGDTTLPNIDVVTSGVALVPGAITATNADASESLNAAVSLEVATNGFGRVYRGTPESAVIVPASALQPDDVQTAELTATKDDGTNRFASKAATGATTVTLPDPIVGASFALSGDEVSATWTSAPAGDVQLSIFANTADFATLWFYELDATADYTGTDTTAAFDLADIPNIPAELRFDFATIQHDRTISVSTGERPTIEGASATVSFNQPQPQPLRPRAALREAHLAAKHLHR